MTENSVVDSDQLEKKDGDLDLACKIPNIDPFSDSMMKLDGNVEVPNCSQYKSYGKLVNGKIQLLGKFQLLIPPDAILLSLVQAQYFI